MKEHFILKRFVALQRKGTTAGTKKTVILLLLLALVISGPFNASAAAVDQSNVKVFPEECFKDSINVEYMGDGRILVLKADAHNKALMQCYRQDAVLLWETSGNEVVTPPVAAAIWWPNDTERFALLARLDSASCRITIFDHIGKAVYSKQINNCIQMPIALNAGLFYVLRQGNTYAPLRMNWDGTIHPINVNTEKYKAVSMVWWESCDVGDGYVLVMNLLDKKDVKHKAIGFFNNDNQLQWLHVLKGGFQRFFIPAMAKDADGHLLVCLDEAAGANRPVLLCFDRQGTVVWQKKIETENPDQNVRIIKPSPKGGFNLWGDAGTEHVCFELVIDKKGEYVSHEYRQADDYRLIEYIDGNPYAEMRNPENHRILLASFHELKKLLPDKPIKLKPLTEGITHKVQ